MHALAKSLLSIIDSSEPQLRGLTDASTPLRPGAWSRKEILGHLIDSASNNHQRFVRASLHDSLEFPGYDQNGCVRMQAPNEADWNILVSLWAAYNRYLAHVIERIPAVKVKTPCRIGSGERLTLEFLARDYVRHLMHHLEQIGVLNQSLHKVLSELKTLDEDFPPIDDMPADPA